MSGCFFVLGLLFLVIALVTLLTPGADERKPYPPAARSPAMVSPPIQPPVQKRQPNPSGGSMSYSPSLSQVSIGKQIRVRHPVRGELTVYVMGRVVYDELWQAQRGPQVPWTPTGNAFSGFWLETNLFLLNWQNRYYLLEEATRLSDAEIQRDFAPHARKFAQSDQTADVYFAYPPASWHIDDIGKFRIRVVEGEGLSNVTGAVGRFVHCSGDGHRALVLEDYESGGGQDVVWTGYQIDAEDIKA
jgi:hypothetical protein